MSSPPLTSAQTHALFDILIHHQLYGEIEAFKNPEAIDSYGYPFRKEEGVQTTSPLLQMMLNKFVLRLPGLQSLDEAIWQDKIRVLVQKLGEAELSESYDKGAIGARKALATAISAILEYVARGILGGWPRRRGKEGLERDYDTSKPEDVLHAFEDATKEVIYGDLLGDTFRRTAETGKLEDHSSLVKGVHEYILLNLASFLHHIFIMSPDGQYILRLLENVHRLIPYYMVKQTLRVGNAATMINGMVRLVLTKLSVTAVTNWIGLTNNSNDGMNLMQQIISTVMAWDTSDFQKKAQKLEALRDAPDKKVYKSVKAFVYSSHDKHDAARQISTQESKSIVAVILETSNPAVETEGLTKHQHAIAMEYYSTLLSIRDREELTKVLCKLQPDVLTSAMREIVAAFDPVIRGIHNAVNLSDTVTDAESFLTDLIKISKPKKNGLGSTPESRSTSRSSSPAPAAAEPACAASITDPEGFSKGDIPTVEDYVNLLRKHCTSLHKFLHQITKNAPDLADQYLVYAKACVAEFRIHDSPSTNLENAGDGDVEGGGAGNMTAPLHSLFSTLSADQQSELRKLLDHHSKHLEQLKSISRSRLQTIMAASCPQPSSTPSKPPTSPARPRGSTHGPGMYLARWHALIDSTLITPATLTGPVRHGYEVKGELDGKGLKTESLLNGLRKQRAKNKTKDSSVNIAEGLGDATERRERKRDGKEEERTGHVWEVMRGGWVPFSRGLEVMGPE